MVEEEGEGGREAAEASCCASQVAPRFPMLAISFFFSLPPPFHFPMDLERRAV